MTGVMTARKQNFFGTMIICGLGLVIKFYKLAISPYLPRACRYRPTCSDYAIEALKRHGLAKGLALTCWRILRCHPWSRGGYDPVPDRRD